MIIFFLSIHEQFKLLIFIILPTNLHSNIAQPLKLKCLSNKLLSILCLFSIFSPFFFSFILIGYKPYMYMSPLTERMRKRKAFADTELESSLFTLPSSSPVSNLSSSYSRLSMLTLPQNMHLSNSITDYHKIQQQSAITSESDTIEYLPTSTMDGSQLHAYPNSKSPSHKIRIIDDAKLANMSRQNIEPVIYSPSSIQQHNTRCTNSKPKLSFSIESIIGIN